MKMPYETRLPCGCLPSAGRYCDAHKFEMRIERGLLGRYLRGDGEYSQYRAAHDKRLGHFKRQAR